MRTYRVTFSGVLVAAAQDLVQINGSNATKKFKIKRMWLGPTTTALAVAQGLKLRARILPATFTVGSGGTTGITPSKADHNDAAATSTTCATNNTTPATTGGTATVVHENGCHLYSGFDWRFDDDTAPIIASTEGFVFELLAAPSGTVNLSGGVEFEEL